MLLLFIGVLTTVVRCISIRINDNFSFLQNDTIICLNKNATEFIHVMDRVFFSSISFMALADSKLIFFREIHLKLRLIGSDLDHNSLICVVFSCMCVYVWSQME